MSETPRVWVGSLAAYNGGNLLGGWFDADEAPTEAREWLDALIERGIIPRLVSLRDADAGADLSRERSDAELDAIALAHEELWVFDHEGFHGLLTGECSPAEAARIAEWMTDVDDDEMPAVAAYASDRGVADVTEIDLDDFREAFCGYWAREADYAMDLAEEIGAVNTDATNGWPFSCIDWDHAWNELRIGGDNWSEYVPGHGYAIFRTI